MVSENNILIEQTDEGPPIPKKLRKEGIEKLNLKYPTKHLLGYDELKAATALFGEEYTLIFKALWYCLVSYQLRTSKISVGRLKPDGRISPLFVINSGRGKGELKRVQKNFVKYFNGKCKEPTSLHAEQLVGKSVYLKKEKQHEERRGYLRSDFLIIDEAFNLLSSKDLHYSEARKYIRAALDPYPQNTVSKQLVELGEDHTLEYEPECPIILFVQPLMFENDILVLEGDIRRFIPVYVFMGESNKVNALKKRVFDSYTDEDSILSFCSMVKELEVLKSFTMSSDAKVRFAELSIHLMERGESYSPKIANFMEMIVFTLQNNLLKFSAVQAFQHTRSVIEVEDVELAFMDLFEVMEHTYQYVEYKIPGNLDYGDGWHGARLKDQEALEWLYEIRATSEESSNISIKEYEDKLMEIFNVKSRQAQKYKNKHESKGWIKSKKGPNVSKVWLNFDPEESERIGALPALGAPYQQYQKIVKNLKSYESFNTKGCAGNAPNAGIKSNDIKKSESLEDDHIDEGKIDYESLGDEDLWNIAYHENNPEAQAILEARVLAVKQGKEGVG